MIEGYRKFFDENGYLPHKAAGALIAIAEDFENKIKDVRSQALQEAVEIVRHQDCNCLGRILSLIDEEDKK